MALRTRVWDAGKLLLLVGALVATYVICAATAMRLALSAREVQVPDLTNRTANEATAAAAALGLTIQVDENRRVDGKIAAGRVITQDPTSGATARRQRGIRVWLSAGQRATRVPALTGEGERSAQLRLAADGFPVAAVSEIRSDVYPSDIVVAQDSPAAGAAGDVALLVNRGSQAVNYIMPDFIGVSGDRAAGVLRGRGFRVAVVGSTPYAGIPAGTVVRQSPQAGFQIAPGEPISFEISR